MSLAVTHRFPSSFRALVLHSKDEQQNKSLYHDVHIVERPIPALKPGEILVKINAAGFNHREVCLGITQKMRGRCGDHPLHY
jgi:D-arabinose 1-dehydrogenase-like Zn-dependent alcohol dehydrogenase